MQEQQGTLEFFSSGTFFGLSLTVLSVAGVLCWLAWQRSGYRKRIGALELLRFVLISLVVLTLNQPEWVQTHLPDQQATLAVLWDTSNSMKTRDVIDTQAPAEKPKSRAETIQPLISEEVWKPLETHDLRIVFEPFSSHADPPEEATDLNAALSQVFDTHANLRGVVLMSDGDWNIGNSPVEAATRFRMRDIPVFTVGVGSQVPLPDLAVVSMDAPTYAVVHKQLRIPFVVRSTLGTPKDVSVTLSLNKKATETKLIRVPAMGQVQENMVWTPPATGDWTLSMRIPQDTQDLIPENNEMSVQISVRTEHLKILVIDSYPRWEYRYLRNALERDPGVELTCLLFHPKLPKVGGGRSYIKNFPTATELNRYDVVFLGDVGIAEKQLTLEQTQALRQLVSAQAAGLVLMPGRTGMHASLMSGPLADLYPVVLDPALPEGVGTGTHGYFTLTQLGHRSLLTRLGETEENNRHVWRTLPGFSWYAAATRAKAGTETLAVHAEASTRSGRIPLIVTKTYGTGKVLFMGTDSAWRWRQGVEDKYHYRFWSQVARWMAYRRHKAQSDAMRLFYSPDRPHVDDVVTLYANVNDPLGAPIASGSVTVQAIAPSGKTQTLRLHPGEGDATGLWTGSFVPEDSGKYQLIAHSRSETIETAVQTDLSVQGLTREQQGRVARFEVLTEIAKITKGTFVSVDDVQNVVDSLAALPEPEPTLHRTRLWAHPLWAGLILGLLTTFWIARKMRGLF